MAKQTINIGSAPNDGTGDPLRNAFEKINDNFTELYNGQSTIPVDLTDLGIVDGSNNQVLTTDGNGNFAFQNGIGISSVVEDTNPQLGDDLDVNGNSIVSTSAGNILITPDTTGSIVLDGLSWPQADGTSGQVLTTDGSGTLSFTTPSGGGISNVVEDTSPQLGGDLDANGNAIYVSDGAGNGKGGMSASANQLLISNNAGPSSGAGISVYASGDLLLFSTGVVKIGDSLAQNSVQIGHTGGGVPVTIPGTVTLSGITHPTTDGTAGQVLTTDGSGTLSWSTPVSGGLQSRTTRNGTTASLADDATGDLNITGFKSYALMSIQTDKAAWVRIYTDAAARTADLTRLQTSDPLPDAGVVAEVITTDAETVRISPATLGFNLENPVTQNIPMSITNLSGSTGTVTVTLTMLQLEA